MEWVLRILNFSENVSEKLTKATATTVLRLGIISISRYRDIDRQPHIATISWDRLHLQCRADVTRLIPMDGNSTQTDARRMTV